MSTSTTYRPSRSDRAGIWAFIVIGAVLTAFTAFAGVRRIIEILGPGPVPVPIRFVDAAASLPYGEPGHQLAIAIDSGVIKASDIPLASTVAGVLSPSALIAVTATIAVCSVLLAISVLRGRIFTRRNTRLVNTAVFTGIIGLPFVNLCDTMLANGAVARATNHELDNLTFTFEPLSYLFIAFTGALVATIFVVGERMQRDTEGLV